MSSSHRSNDIIHHRPSRLQGVDDYSSSSSSEDETDAYVQEEIVGTPFAEAEFVEAIPMIAAADLPSTMDYKDQGRDWNDMMGRSHPAEAVVAENEFPSSSIWLSMQ
jgi:hypothetical protein